MYSIRNYVIIPDYEPIPPLILVICNTNTNNDLHEKYSRHFYDINYQN